jgi:putative ABC transport system permease protein
MLLRNPDVEIASPVLELSTFAQPLETMPTPPSRLLLRVVGVDALEVFNTAPDLMPIPAQGMPRTSIFSPDVLFLNAAARQALPGETVALQQGLQTRTLRVAGQVHASGPALAVMDIGAMQDLFGKVGQLTRIDIRLHPGVSKSAFVRALQSRSDWPAAAQLSEPADAEQRISNLSRAYRVNLTVLALIALFTGGFLVFSVLSLSVTRRAQQFALLGVLGLAPRLRLALVLLEAAALGLAGSIAGLVLGAALAALGLRWLGGDLGGGYFSGSAPELQWGPGAALVFGALGLACALAGAWWPARAAQRLPPAQTLKGLGHQSARGNGARAGGALLLIGVLLAFLPPIGAMALAAYCSVAILLLGGIIALPTLVGWLLDALAPFVTRHALALLAVERARRVRESAAVAVSGVVAALSLAVALTVMVNSFRTSVTQWLDSVLPAALYVRASTNTSANEAAYLNPAFVREAARVEGVERLIAQHSLSLNLDPTRPALALITKPLRDPVTQAVALPLVADALAIPPGRIGIYVSEAVVDLYGVKLGGGFSALAAALKPISAGAPNPNFFVAGVWRDYARQFGTVAIDQVDFAKLSNDDRVNDIAVWLHPGANIDTVEAGLRALATKTAKATSTQQGAGQDAGAMLEFGSAAEIRRTTLTIFDRSFAVTYWLQAVAIGIGLFGVAASFSAQVLARRKEFGLLQHLGLTRTQVLRVVAAEGAAWTCLGAIAGIGLGLAAATVLVKVVNPQSFHWTMEMNVPWLHLVALALAVIAAGTVTAQLAGRAAAGRDAVLAVKEDW